MPSLRRTSVACRRGRTVQDHPRETETSRHGATTRPWPRPPAGSSPSRRRAVRAARRSTRRTRPPRRSATSRRAAAAGTGRPRFPRTRPPERPPTAGSVGRAAATATATAMAMGQGSRELPAWGALWPPRAIFTSGPRVSKTPRLSRMGGKLEPQSAKPQDAKPQAAASVSSFILHPLSFILPSNPQSPIPNPFLSPREPVPRP